MSTILATNKSSSSDNTYHVVKGNDGVVYCDCPGWRFHARRWCKHLEAYHSGMPNASQFKQAVKNGDSIDEVTARVIAELRGN